MKEEEDARLKKEKDTLASVVAARKQQAELLQGFVGFHKKFCVVALEKNGDNVEMAAEWAMANFETFNSERPDLFMDDAGN